MKIKQYIAKIALFILLIYPTCVLSQKRVIFEGHLGIGLHLLKLDEQNTRYRYFYRTFPKSNMELGIKANFWNKKYFSIYSEFALSRMVTDARRIIGIIPHQTNPNELEYRQEYWSDFISFNTLLKCGIRSTLKKKYSIGIGPQSIINIATLEKRQEKWLAFPYSESVFFESERLNAKKLFRKYDYGIHTFISYRVTKLLSFSIEVFFTNHSVMNPDKGNWMENRTIIFSTIYNFH